MDDGVELRVPAHGVPGGRGDIRRDFQVERQHLRPLMWSLCSCEMTSASKLSVRSPTAASRAYVSLRLRPASMSRRVFSVATSVELPRLPLPSTQTRTLK